MGGFHLIKKLAKFGKVGGAILLHRMDKIK